MLYMNYFRGVIREFSRVRWLSLRRAVILTVIVIICTFIAGFVLGAFDNVLFNVIKGVTV